MKKIVSVAILILCLSFIACSKQLPSQESSSKSISSIEISSSDPSSHTPHDEDTSQESNTESISSTETSPDESPDISSKEDGSQEGNDIDENEFVYITGKDKDTYEKYFKELGSIVGSLEWETPSDISPFNYVMWYGYRVKELPNSVISNYLIEDRDGLYFPEQEFEEAILSYFTVPIDHLRSNPDIYLEAEHLYRTVAPLAPLSKKNVEILDVKQNDSIMKVEFKLSFAQFDDTKNMVLEIKDESDGFKFLSYKSN